MFIGAIRFEWEKNQYLLRTMRLNDFLSREFPFIKLNLQGHYG